MVRLDREHIDFDQGILTIEHTKFGKSRMVPLHVSTRDALVEYDQARDRLFPVTTTRAFFVSERGSRVK